MPLMGSSRMSSEEENDQGSSNPLDPYLLHPHQNELLLRLDPGIVPEMSYEISNAHRPNPVLTDHPSCNYVENS